MIAVLTSCTCLAYADNHVSIGGVFGAALIPEGHDVYYKELYFRNINK